MSTLLRYEEDAENIYTDLKALPRTGWVMRDIENPETVYDHTVALVKMTHDLYIDLDLTEGELDHLTLILEVHDWAESIVGDEVILDKNPDDHKTKKSIKQQKERVAMQQICTNKPYGKLAYDAWQEYEAGETKLGKLAKQLDKYQAVEQALEYEKSTGTELFNEFDLYSKEHIYHPVLVGKLEGLREQHSQLKPQ